MATTDRVLIEIITAANTAGIKQTMASFLKLHATTLLLAGGLGLLVGGGKSMLDNWQKIEASNKLLEQSVGGNKDAYDKLQGTFDEWVHSNKRYISDQADAEEALGKLKRAKLSDRDAMRMLNDSLDLSAIKHISVSDAATLLIKVWAGSPKVLKDLGISTEQYNGIMKSHLTTAQKHEALLKLIETRTKDGRKAIDESKQSSNELNNSWMELSKKGGPVLETGLKAIIDLLNTAYDWFDRIGKDDALWAAISGRLTDVADAIHNLFIVPIIRAYNALARIAGWQQLSEESGAQAAAAMAKSQSGTHGGYKGGKAAGGPVTAGGIYTVGERGPETLVMGSRSGRIYPNGSGGRPIVININGGMFMDHGPTIDRLTNTIAQRLRMVSGI